jgi:adenylate cyclase
VSIDTITIIKETQSRIENSLENGFEYDHSVWVDESADFLRKRITSKLQMIVLYIDLVGSTKMILELPEEKIATIISSFSQEMGYVIRQHDG